MTLHFIPATNAGARRPVNVHNTHDLTTQIWLYHTCYRHVGVVKSDLIPDSTTLSVRWLPTNWLDNPVHPVTSDFLMSLYNRRALNPDSLYV